MGIKKLFTFLDNNNLYKKYEYLNDLIQESGIDKKKLLVGVDGNLFCYKYTHSYDNMLIGFFNQILKFLSNKIIPIYIFDGGTLQEKENTNIFRYQKKIGYKYKLEQLEEYIDCLNEEDNKEIYNKDDLLFFKKKLEKNSTIINNDNILVLLELFDLLNIPYLFSYGEGEYLAVMLNKYNIIDFFLTDDTDPIPAGIKKTIKFCNNNVYYLETEKIYNYLKLNKNELCDFCILLGSDYFVLNHGLKPNELYELILKYKTIEEIINKKVIDGINIECLNIINKIRNIYNNSDDYERKKFLENKNIFYKNNKINLDDNNKMYSINSSVNSIIDHSDISFYSNIMLEHWDEYIEILKNELSLSNTTSIIKKSNNFKNKICNYIIDSKFNIKNIIKFIKNNIDNITDNEVNNMIISFEFLNNFGI